MEEKDRLVRLHMLQGRMQVLWERIEATEKTGRTVAGLWVEFNALEMMERSLLRPGRLQDRFGGNPAC